MQQRKALFQIFVPEQGATDRANASNPAKDLEERGSHVLVAHAQVTENCGC